MSLPQWPIAKYTPVQDSFQPVKVALDPITTEMEGGNVRLRPRPGDNVGELTQTIWMTNDDCNTFKDWVKNTLNLGTARFTTQVWLGTKYETKVCQFVKPGTTLTYGWLSANEVAVTMTLRVYGV